MNAQVPAKPSAQAIRLQQRADGVLVALAGEKETPVRVVRCFPWSHAAEWLSLRDDEDNEVALVRAPEDLDEESAVALREALALAGFVFVVRAVLDVQEEFEIRAWTVRTDQGQRRFQTARDEWPREVPGGALLIRDVAGDHFLIPDPESMDEQSQKLLWALVD